MKIWLDDIRPAPEGWTHILTVEETLAWLQRGEVTHLDLDHDLGYEKTGMDVLVWIEQAIVHPTTLIPPSLYIHTMNPYAYTQMHNLIEKIKSIGRRVE